MASQKDLGNSVQNMGSRLELFIDDWLIAETRNVELRLHNPVPQEVSIARFSVDFVDWTSLNGWTTVRPRASIFTLTR